MAGNIVTEKTNASITPIATIFPRWAKGGASEKFIVIKPIAVVKLVRNTGCILTLRLSLMAECLSMP